MKGSGLPWVIARPSIITGEREDGRLGERSAAVVGDGLLAVVGVLGAQEAARALPLDDARRARLGADPDRRGARARRHRRRFRTTLATIVIVMIAAIVASEAMCGMWTKLDSSIFTPANTRIADSPMCM